MRFLFFFVVITMAKAEIQNKITFARYLQKKCFFLMKHLCFYIESILYRAFRIRTKHTYVQICTQAESHAFKVAPNISEKINIPELL